MILPCSQLLLCEYFQKWSEQWLAKDTWVGISMENDIQSRS